MSHDDIPALCIFQAIPEFLVQLVKFTGIFLIIRFIIILILRIRFYKSILNIRHLLFRPHRIQPDMGIFSIIAMSMILTSIQKLHTIRCLRHHQILIFQSVQHIFRPVFQVRAIVDKNIRILKIPDIRRRRFPVMRLRSRRNHILHLDLIAAHLPGKIIHGIKAGHHFQPAIIHKRLPHCSGPVQSITGHTSDHKERCRQNRCRSHLPSVKIHFFLLHSSQYP